MNRRAFLKSLIVTGLIAPLVKASAPEAVTNKNLGISIRFLKHWDVVKDEGPTILPITREQARRWLESSPHLFQPVRPMAEYRPIGSSIVWLVVD